jgi:predicted nucleic acid-binding protein
MALICLDTQILVWGVRKVASLGQEQNIIKAENLIDLIVQKKDSILVPSIVYAELCAPIPEEMIQSFMREMQKKFPIVPFDVNAAYYYRQLVQANAPLREQYKNEYYTRSKQFADMKIVATALACKATTIYSEDPHLTRIANGRIEVRPMPSVPPKQLTLMEDTQRIIQ